MGYHKNQAIERDGHIARATDMLVEAEHLSRCDLHEDIVYGETLFHEDNVGDVVDALHAELGGDREDAADIVKDALESAGMSCTICENNMLRDD